MSAQFALDTNVLSELRKSSAHPAVVAWSRSVPATSLYIPTVVLMELRHGAALIRRRGDVSQADGVDRWIDSVVAGFDGRFLDFTFNAATYAVRVTSRSDAPGLADVMIAATAHVHGMTVATRNVADFSRTGVSTIDPWAADRY